MIDALTRQIFGSVAVTPEGGKVARAYAQQPLVQGGQVYLPEGAPWVEDFLREHSAFPNGRHDDEVDAFTQAMAQLAWTAHERKPSTRIVDEDRHPGWDTETHAKRRYDNDEHTRARVPMSKPPFRANW